MLSEALVKANPVFHFDQVVHCPKLYLKLMDDDLLMVIRNSRKPELKESRDLLHRIEVRDIYKCAGERSISKRIK